MLLTKGRWLMERRVAATLAADTDCYTLYGALEEAA